MLPCARSCIGKKLNPLPAACADSITTEPLIFLYPRWFQIEYGQVTYLESRRVRNFSSITKNRGFAAAATLADDDMSTHATNSGRQERRSKTDDGDELVFPLKSLDVPRAEHTPLPRAWMNDNWRPFKQEIAGTKARQEKPSKIPKKVPESESQHHQGARFEARISKLIAKLVGVHAKIAASKKSIVTESLELDTDFLEWLTGTSSENSWRHHDGSGCTIHVNAPAQQNNGKRRLSLAGSSRAMEITSHHLKQLELDYRETRQRESADSDVSGQTPMSNSYQRVDQLPLPEVWTLKTFSDYIGAVTNFSTPRNVDRTLYPNEESFNKVVASILMDLFTTPSLQPFQSSFALRQALSFCSTRTDIAFAARTIWLSARRNEILPDVECFNFEINRRLRVRNIGTTEKLLDEMHSLNVQPNGGTWASFFRHLRNKDAQDRVLQLPRVRALNHNPSSRRFLIEALVETTFQPSDEDSRCVLDFNHRMHSIFGSKWLTSSVACRMIEQCNRARAPRTVARVLKAAEKALIGPDSISLTPLLQTTTQTNWFRDVLLLLKMQKSRDISRLDQKQVELAFKASWKSRLINTCRVLWHYAASHGIINHDMVTKVSAAISQNVHPDRGLFPRFTAWMAVIIVSPDQSVPTDRGFPSPDAKAHVASKFAINLGRWQPVGEARHTQMQLAHVFIERDLTAWQRVRPMDYDALLDLLEQAFSMDTSWQDQALVSKLSLTELTSMRIALDPSPYESQDGAEDSQKSPHIMGTKP